MVHKALNELEGITCNEADGALYAFPRIRLSNKAKQAAEAKGVPPDEYYCIKVGSGRTKRSLWLFYRNKFVLSIARYFLCVAAVESSFVLSSQMPKRRCRITSHLASVLQKKAEAERFAFTDSIAQTDPG